MKNIFSLFALLFLAFSTQLSYSQDTLWTRRYDIPGSIKNAVFSPDDSKILVTGTETFFEVNPQNGEMIRELPEFTKSGIWDVDVESNLGITFDYKLVNLLDYSVFSNFVEKLQNYGTPRGSSHNKDFSRVAILFAGKDNVNFDTLKIVNAKTNEPISEIYSEQSVQGLISFKISPDGKYLATICGYYGVKETTNDDRTILRLYDVMSKQEIKKIEFPDSQVLWTMKFSPDVSMLAVNDGYINIYSVPNLEFTDKFQFIPQTDEIKDYKFNKESNTLFINGPLSPIQEINIKNNTVINEYIFRYGVGFLAFPNNELRSIIAGSTGGLMLYPYLKTSIPKDNITQTIYPNPATGVLILKLPNSQSGSFKITILNSISQNVFSKDYQSSNEEISINASLYPSGVYFINIESNNRILQTLKFIKD